MASWRPAASRRPSLLVRYFALAGLLYLLLLLFGRESEADVNSSICLEWLDDSPCEDWHTCAVNQTAAHAGPEAGVATCASDGPQDMGKGAPGRALVADPGEPQHDPSLHVLVVHEQQPQALGCDRRLLALVRLLQEEGRRVSLLYRHGVPPSEQAPPTTELAELLGVSPFNPSHLSGCLRPPPALYEYTGDERQLQRLAQRGWFGLILVTVWFWNDPSPSFAEVTLPVLRAHAPHALRFSRLQRKGVAGGRSAQPFIALLVDDAHALRASRLADWESDTAVRQAYVDQAASLLPHVASLYRSADLVAHVSAEDSRAERAAFPFVARWQVCRAFGHPHVGTGTFCALTAPLT